MQLQGLQGTFVPDVELSTLKQERLLNVLLDHEPLLASLVCLNLLYVFSFDARIVGVSLIIIHDVFSELLFGRLLLLLIKFQSHVVL